MLSNEDVQEILQLLDTTDYRQLKLETDNFRLTLQRHDQGWSAQQDVLREADISPGEAPSTSASDTPPRAPAEATHPGDHLHAVQTPLPGTFYRAPKPGAPPYVEMGSRVEADTQVCIIETMKLMNAVYAGVPGTVKEICREDGEFADQDSTVMRIEPDGDSA